MNRKSPSSLEDNYSKIPLLRPYENKTTALLRPAFASPKCFCCCCCFLIILHSSRQEGVSAYYFSSFSTKKNYDVVLIRTPIQIHWKFHYQKTESFQIKILLFFMSLLKIIECGYSLEAPMRNHFLTNESNFHENSSRFQKNWNCSNR